MILGNTRLGVGGTILAADTGYVTPFNMPTPGFVSAVTVAVDGLGLAGGSQDLIGVLYAPSGTLLAYSDPIPVDAGAPLTWMVFSFTAPASVRKFGLLLRAAHGYKMGVLAGPGEAARLIATGPLGHGLLYHDAFADGPSTPLPEAVQSTDWTMFLGSALSYAAPEGVTDGYLGRLPHSAAQATFSSTGVLAKSGRNAAVGWHGTRTDPEFGSFCLVRTGGPLEDLVGERLKVSNGDRAVYAYCHRDADIIEDLSVTRRLFTALDYPATTQLDGYVEVMAAAEDRLSSTTVAPPRPSTAIPPHLNRPYDQETYDDPRFG